MSLFNRIGGQEAITLITNKFFDYLIADPTVNVVFKNIDIKKKREDY